MLAPAANTIVNEQQINGRLSFVPECNGSENKLSDCKRRTTSGDINLNCVPLVSCVNVTSINSPVPDSTSSRPHDPTLSTPSPSLTVRPSSPPLSLPATETTRRVGGSVTVNMETLSSTKTVSPVQTEAPSSTHSQTTSLSSTVSIGETPNSSSGKNASNDITQSPLFYIVLAVVVLVVLVVLVVVMVLTLIVCCRRRRKKSPAVEDHSFHLPLPGQNNLTFFLQDKKDGVPETEILYDQIKDLKTTNQQTAFTLQVPGSGSTGHSNNLPPTEVLYEKIVVKGARPDSASAQPQQPNGPFYHILERPSSAARRPETDTHNTAGDPAQKPPVYYHILEGPRQNGSVPGPDTRASNPSGSGNKEPVYSEPSQKKAARIGN